MIIHHLVHLKQGKQLQEYATEPQALVDYYVLSSALWSEV